MIGNYIIDWPAVATFLTALIALYGAYRANVNATAATSVVAIQQIALMRNDRLKAFQDAVAKYASLASGLTKSDFGPGYILRNEFAHLREYSAQIRMLAPFDDPERETLFTILSDEIGILSADEKMAIQGDHLYSIAERMVSRELNKIETDLRKYNAKN